MRDVLVLGAGKSGVAAANFLVARGVRTLISDSKKEEEIPLLESIDQTVDRWFGGHPESLLSGVDTIILSPGIPRSIPILQTADSRGIPVISEIELAFRHLHGKVIAITGSNGKSTTTALIGEILAKAGLHPIVAGNIGDPLIGSISEEPRIYVIELSSFQLETVESFRADVALLLNITPDHMDRYATLADYQAAKERIFRNQTAADIAIVNADDARTVNPPTNARVLRFSSTGEVKPGAWFDGESMILDVDGTRGTIPRSALRISGIANVENALASWLAARAVGASDAHVQLAFESFGGLPHRMVLVRELEGVRWINDSKGTNVDATVKSLEGQEDGKVLLILGGKDKAGEFERLRPLIEKKARLLLTVGAAAPKIESVLAGSTEIVSALDMQRAVQIARERAQRGDTVLLSPACASFDQYKSFEHRGRHFEELVRDLR